MASVGSRNAFSQPMEEEPPVIIIVLMIVIIIGFVVTGCYNTYTCVNDCFFSKKKQDSSRAPHVVYPQYYYPGPNQPYNYCPVTNDFLRLTHVSPTYLSQTSV